MSNDLTETQSVVLNQKLEAMDAVAAAQTNAISQLVVALNHQRMVLNAIVKTLADQGIEVDVPEFDEN